MNAKERLLDYLSVREEAGRLDRNIVIENLKIGNKSISRIKLAEEDFIITAKDRPMRLFFKPEPKEAQIIKQVELSDLFREKEYLGLKHSNRIISEYFDKIPSIYKLNLAFGIIIVVGFCILRGVIGTPFFIMGLVGGFGVSLVAFLGSLEIIHAGAKFDNKRVPLDITKILDKVRLSITDKIYKHGHRFSATCIYNPIIRKYKR
jgi:hypothetical protein